MILEFETLTVELNAKNTAQILIYLAPVRETTTFHTVAPVFKNTHTYKSTGFLFSNTHYIQEYYHEYYVKYKHKCVLFGLCSK